MTLYVLRSCPYCQRVLRWLEGREIDIDIVDVPPFHSMRSAVRDASGQTYVPTLVDGEVVIADDDSAIIDYLSQKESALEAAK